MKNKKYIFALLSLCILCGLFFFVKEDTTKGENTSQEIEISSSYPYFTPEEKIQRSYLVVEAKFKGHLPPFKIKPTNGGAPLIHKDSQFEVIKVFKGDIQEKEIIQIRSLGGKYKGESTSSDFDSISYNGKQNYLFFLTKFPFDTYKTDEDYYDTVTGPFGIYIKGNDGIFYGVADSQDAIDPSLLENSTDATNPRDIYLQQLKESYERGQLTTEEYENTLAEENRFGTVERE